MIIVLKHKRNLDYYENPSLTRWWINFDYKENSGKKSFLANPEHQYHVSQYVEHDCSAQSQKKNGDCYENPSLTYLMDKL